MKLCICGCERAIEYKTNQNYIYGHRKRELINAVDTLCKCGCGEITNKGRKFVYGHSSRGDNNPAKKPEVRQKISEMTTGEKNGFYGKHHTEETKEIIRESSLRFTGEDAHFYGKSHSEETKIKMSEAQLKRFEDPEERNKLAKTMKGREFSEKHRKNLSKALKGKPSPLKGSKKSDETKQKFRKRMLNGDAAKAGRISKIKYPIAKQYTLYQIVLELYSKAEYEFQIKNYFVDIAIPEIKIVIELDGEYHKRSKTIMHKDHLRQEAIESEGWAFLRYEQKFGIPNKTQLMNDISNILRK